MSHGNQQIPWIQSQAAKSGKAECLSLLERTRMDFIPGKTTKENAIKNKKQTSSLTCKISLVLGKAEMFNEFPLC